MPFHIETWDKPGHQAARQQLRPAHLDFLAAHAHLLLACDAKLDDDGADAGGGIYIVDLDDRAAAERFIAADPFHAGGLFREVRLTRWRKAYVAGVCRLSGAAAR
ncbi:YciI family protein [Xylophilus sp.]|uniref:YciI family protein n=1 Tax=Xylophilus sp. TaxID=2653893 RepID=UPI0013BB6232|nr:YciI family protein [Xylophilus sp.]KAF1046742.1 MAG: hypothetical protein GAK38_02305 [Xylophilus sp.]